MDVYANVFSKSVTMSGANTLTFEELDFGLNLFDKVGILLHQVKFDIPKSAYGELVTNADRLMVALTQSNQVTDLNYAEQAVIDALELDIAVSGTPANMEIHRSPEVIDYTMYPGGGMLIAPKPLYLAMNTEGFAAASACTMRMFFTIVKLKPEEYFELLESRTFFG